MTFDWVEWQLELDRLQAEAAELADTVCRTMADGQPQALTRALEHHVQWVELDKQVADHMVYAEKQRSRG